MKSAGPALALAMIVVASHARARCDVANQLSTCIDVDTLWPHAGDARFAFVGGATTTSPGRFGLALVTTYLSRPLVLQAPASTVGGTEIVAVDHMLDGTLLWALGVARGFELSLAVPLTLYRSGTGISALTAQHTTELSRTAMRDPRIGATFALTGGRAASGWGHSVVSRLELALPLGQASGFAGDRFIVARPAFAAELSYDRFVFAGELGARLRATSELAGSRVGPQLELSIGVAAKLIDDELLSLQLEAVTLPTLVGQHELERPANSGERVVSGSRPWLLPTEWQASLRSAPLLDGAASASIGAGGAIPVGGEYGITSPAFRVVVSLRYQPRAAAQR